MAHRTARPETQSVRRRGLLTAALALIALPAARAQTTSPAPAPNSVPQVDLERLKRPAPSKPPNDLFNSRSWETRTREVRPPPPPPPPPQAPPLPFAYVGRWLEGGETIVVLARDRQHYIAHAGDKLDGTYLLETIDGDKVVLRYLPLNIAQVLPFTSGAAPPGGVPRAPTFNNERGRQRPPDSDTDDEDD